MAANTPLQLQNQIIYSVYVRNHTPEGTFRAVIPDLQRIHALGTGIVWLLPIHPIGEKNKKGSLGCPYAIRDYRAVNPAYGTMADFRALVDAIHAHGMRCIIDVVYNHTSPDSVLFQTHPEWFYHRADGTPGNRVGDWTDVIDLDYVNQGLWGYQIETLCRWAEIVDGFRCDAASFVPLAFWKQARADVERVRPGAIWLAESVHRSFGAWARREGMYAATDLQLFDAFDMEYEYDVWEAFEDYLAGKTTLSHWLDLQLFQASVYPANAGKLRFLENHDQPRIASRLSGAALRSHTALLYFRKGPTLLYAGQEWSETHLPSLFEREPVSRAGEDLTPLLQSLAAIKKQLGADDALEARADNAQHVAVLKRTNADGKKLGIFPLRGTPSRAEVDWPDGDYVNRIDGELVRVQNGVLQTGGEPIILFG